MRVEGHSLHDPLAAHQDEARTIREAIGLVRPSLEERPGRPLVRGRHVEQFNDRFVEESPSYGDGATMPEPGLGERDRLVENVARGDEANREFVQHVPDATMIRVSSVDVSKPSARVDEDSPARHVRRPGPYSQRS